MDKSYAEVKGEPFNWFEFLNRETFTRDELEAAYEKGAEWVTCAVGNQCEIIPRNDEGAPLDGKLDCLGMEFFNAIRKLLHSPDSEIRRSRKQAIKTLERIEERSFILITELVKETNLKQNI